MTEFRTHRLRRFLLKNPSLLLLSLWILVLLATPPHTAHRSQIHENRISRVRGWISSVVRIFPDSLYFQVTPISIRQDERSMRPEGCLAVYVYSSSRQPSRFFDPPLQFGDEVSFTAFLRRPTRFADPGVIDLRQQARARGVEYVVHLKSPRLLEFRGRKYFSLLTRPVTTYALRFKIFCLKHLSYNTVKYLFSIFLGNKHYLTDSDMTHLKELGILHFFVVSGFHTSIVALLAYLALGCLGRWGLVFVPPAVWSYVLISGIGLPVLRAGVTTTLIYYLWLFGLKVRFLNGIALSLTLVLIFFPARLQTQGFQFTLVSLLAIGLLVLPAQAVLAPFFRGMGEILTDRVSIDEGESDRARRRWRFFFEERLRFFPGPVRAAARFLAKPLFLLASAWQVSLYIQIALLPVALFFSNIAVWTQSFANALLAPFCSLLVPACLLFFLLYWSPFGAPVGWILAALFGDMDRLLQFLGHASLHSYLPQPTAPEVYFYYAILLLVCLRFRRLIALLLLPLGFCFYLSLPHTQRDGTLSITLLDVGQGEAIHLHYPDGSNAMVDSGGNASPRSRESDFIGARVVARYLWREGTRSLRFVLLSHPHFDHIQGLRFLKRAFYLQRVYFYQWSNFYRGPPGRRLLRGDSFVVGGVEHLVVHPGSRFASSLPPDDANDRSLVLLLTYGHFSMLFTGDIEKTAEQALSRRLSHITVLKAAHHGGATSNSSLLLDTTHPRLVVISAGRHNAFGHPSAAVKRRLHERGIPYVVTARSGAIRIITDGLGWSLCHYSLSEQRFIAMQPWRRLPALFPASPETD